MLPLAIVAFVAATVLAILASRRRVLRELGHCAKSGLTVVTAGLFDAPPTASVSPGGIARLRGTRGRQALGVEAVYTTSASRRYMRTGYQSGIIPEVSVVMDLRGGEPSFSFHATQGARALAEEVA